jgi:hypothetical protein
VVTQIAHAISIEFLPVGDLLDSVRQWAGAVHAGCTVVGALVGALIGYRAHRQDVHRLSSFAWGSIVALVLYPIVIFLWLSPYLTSDGDNRERLIGTPNWAVLVGMFLAALLGGFCGIVIGARRVASESIPSILDDDISEHIRSSKLTNDRSDQITDGSHRGIQGTGEPHA